MNVISNITSNIRDGESVMLVGILAGAILAIYYWLCVYSYYSMIKNPVTVAPNLNYAVGNVHNNTMYIQKV